MESAYLEKYNKNQIQTWVVVLALTVILAVGSFLRIYGLGSESLALDEFHSLETSDETLGSIITGKPLATNPPLYFVCLRIWVEFFGTSDTALRSLSVVFGILSIIAMYVLGTTLFDEKTALVCSLISAVSLYHIEYSQEARPYPLFLLLSLLSMTVFAKVLKRGQKQDYIFGTITNVLLVYTHNYALFIISVQVIYLLLYFKTYRSKMKNLVIMYGTTGILCIPLILFIFSGSSKIDTILSWINKPTLKDIVDLIVIFSGKSLVLAFIFLILMMSAFMHFNQNRIYFPFSIKKKEEVDKAAVYLVHRKYLTLIFLWLLTPIVFSFIISWTVIPIFHVRYFIGCSGAYYLLAACGLSRLNAKKFLFPVLFALLFFAYFPLKESYLGKNKVPWKEVTSFIEKRYQKSDIILLQPGYIQIAFDRYYHKTANFIKVHRGLKSEEKIQRIIQNLIWNRERIWLVVRFEPFPFSMRAYLSKRLGSKSLVLKKSYPGVMVYLFDIKKNE